MIYKKKSFVKINKNFKTLLFYLVLIIELGILSFQIINENQKILLFRTVNSFIKSFLTVFPIIYLIFSSFLPGKLTKDNRILYLLVFNLLYIPIGLLMGEDFIHFLYILPISLIAFVKVLIEVEIKFRNLILGFICAWGIINALQNTSQKFAFSEIYKQNFYLETKFSKKIKVEKTIKSDYEFITNFIEQNTKPGDYIFVWGTDPILNFLCDRMSPSKYILFLFTSITFEEETINSLKKNNVKYIIVRKFNIYNPFYKQLEKFDKINNFIQNNYKIIFRLENFNILEKINNNEKSSTP
ncbi:MAG: hypothetical protein NC833_06765 [Candidatus Omnitrophica bacterium]|nr:hypothetical protein [Candidatus Omnitrophota bacterium]